MSNQAALWSRLQLAHQHLNANDLTRQSESSPTQGWKYGINEHFCKVWEGLRSFSDPLRTHQVNSWIHRTFQIVNYQILLCCIDLMNMRTVKECKMGPERSVFLQKEKLDLLQHFSQQNCLIHSKQTSLPL